MARRRDDDEDDDFVPTVGRPRSPEQFGPPRPQAHEREEYFKRLASILEALEIPDLGRSERLYLQRVMYRADFLRRFDPKRFANADGDAQAIMILRSIAETANGLDALTLPIIQAVSDCMHEAWTSRGLEWLAALDNVPLFDIHRTLNGFGLADRLSDAVRFRLMKILGPPTMPQPKPKKPTRKPVKPSSVSQEIWNDVIALRKKDRQRREQHRRRERMVA